ncbi:hypothetical protein SH203_01400 [Brevundimonas sp. SH203]|uniref:hypothetical protein n=1 Tax=Brevundimonas sp. SH203 TaxID=345167 RepID=UPI0009D08386|nr:hypothetical protein [Brevundimonas sp. SH203]GAW40997.1 hypothetical protein SH203_01400 [Brevundimonas sp. SH203]
MADPTHIPDGGVTGPKRDRSLIGRLRRFPVWPYLMLTLPMWVVALILGAVTHSDLPYTIWAILWAGPFLILMAARWIYFIVTLIWALLVEIIRAMRKASARPD